MAFTKVESIKPKAPIKPPLGSSGLSLNAKNKALGPMDNFFIFPFVAALSAAISCKPPPPPISTNGKIENFKQGNTGDCWALAAIHTLAKTKNGAEIIKNSIKKLPSGNVVVELKGAKESYRFTPEQVNDAKGRLSQGDDDVRLLEMALEQHRLKLLVAAKDKKASIEDLRYISDFANPSEMSEYVGSGTLSEPLDGGFGANAIFLLTGKTSKTAYDYQGANVVANAEKEIDNIKKDERFSLAESQRKQSLMYQIKASGVKTQEATKKINEKLDEFSANPGRFAVTGSFYQYDKKQGIYTCHAYSLKSVDGDKVILVNPWNSKEETVISRKEFLSNYNFWTFCDME